MMDGKPEGASTRFDCEPGVRVRLGADRGRMNNERGMIIVRAAVYGEVETTEITAIDHSRSPDKRCGSRKSIDTMPLYRLSPRVETSVPTSS